MRTCTVRLRPWPTRARPSSTALGLSPVILALAIGDPAVATAQVGAMDRTWPASGSASVAVRAPHATVRVDVWDREEVRVRKTDPARRQRVEVTPSPASGLIVAVEPVGPIAAGRRRSDTVFVTVPRHASLSVKTYWGAIQVVGAEGDVALESYFEEAVYRGGAPRVSVRGFHSPIMIEAPHARSIVAESGGGDVHVLSGGGRLRVETVRGDIEARARGALAEADLRSTGGSILLSAPLAATATIALDTHHGTLDVELDPGVGARLRLETYLGAIENALGPSAPARRSGPVRANALDFSLGEGGALIVASTYRGDIRLHRRE